MRKEMTGIYTTSVNQGTLDEAPMAYKPMDSIINNISETVEINEVIQTNFLCTLHSVLSLT